MLVSFVIKKFLKEEDFKPLHCLQTGIACLMIRSL